MPERKPNRYRVEGAEAYLELTAKGAVVAEAIVSVSDLEKVLGLGYRWQPNWSKQQKQWRAQAVTWTGERYRTVLLHRFILDAPEGMEVDHIDRNPLNNRRENLRLVTSSQNKQNQTPVRRNTKTGVRGVSWKAEKGRFVAAITVNGRQTHVGYFKTLEAAAAAVKEARARHYTHASEFTA